MKSSIVLALIVGGVVSILAPIGADYLHERLVVQLMSKPEIASVHLLRGISDNYAMFCYVAGAAMVAMAVRMAGRGRCTEQDESS